MWPFEYRFSGKTKDGLNQRVTRVYEDDDPDNKALCIDIEFLGKLQRKSDDVCILQEGIWEYKLRCIVKGTADGYVICDSALATISEGALDIDFYAESLDQG